MSHWFSWIRLDALPDTTLLLFGILVGLVAKNLYTIGMRSFGFAGGFASRLAVGWWEEFRRETPNVIDFAMVAVSDCEGRRVLLMDPLIGPRRLNDVYLNPRTAFGLRMQTFSITESVPWVRIKLEEKPDLVVRLLRGYRRWKHHTISEPLSPLDRRLLKIRRIYAPIENLIGQYLTNEWAAQMAIGEPCHVFHFVVALVYEKNADHHMDRHFHALVIWEELLRQPTPEKVVTYHPEFSHRWDTIQRIGEHYRSLPEAAAEFGWINVMIPKRSLVHAYDVDWVNNPAGDLVPVSRPARAGLVETTPSSVTPRRARPG
jgi:hypothetical protein